MRNIKAQNYVNSGMSIIFFLITVAYLIFLTATVAIYGYNESFLLLNNNHLNWLDWPMFIITHLGDSLILTSILCLILIRKHPETVVNIIIAVVITGLLGQLLKQALFDGWDRPIRVFEGVTAIHTLPNYRLFHNSFPSGHSITVASAFTILILNLKPKPLTQACIGLLIVIISYSRIYLGAHFPGDVLTGMLIGLIISYILFFPINKLTGQRSYPQTFKTIMTIIAIVGLITEVWLLRIYIPF